MKDISNNSDIDTKLQELYTSDNVPDYLNIALKNRIAAKASTEKKKIELWWLPAVLNTVIATIGIIFTFVLFEMARIGGSYTIIPNIINKTSELALKITLIGALIDLLAGWLATAIMIPAAKNNNY
ncbi:MAG: hypothetical protein E7271_04920 [Lachnospiraceae bacterium]|jgi:drug/metabolite transporter superfamily protein YnfA|nr:hypothetical protein [Lachnospiraceae bacterium]